MGKIKGFIRDVTPRQQLTEDVDKLLKDQAVHQVVRLQPGRGPARHKPPVEVPLALWQKLLRACHPQRFAFVDEDSQTITTPECVRFASALRDAEQAVQWSEAEKTVLRRVLGVLFEGAGVIITRA